MALLVQTGQLRSRSNTAASASSASILTPNSERSGLQVSADLDKVYLLLYTGADGSAANAGTASATAWDIAIAAGGSWPGTVGGVIWSGGVVAVAPGTPTGRVAVIET